MLQNRTCLAPITYFVSNIIMDSRWPLGREFKIFLKRKTI